MRIINVWMDLMMVGVALVVASSITLAVAVQLNQNMVYYTHDKTGFETLGEITIHQEPRTGFDLLAMLVNTDHLVPYPNIIKIDNSPAILLDSTFQPSKFKTISNIYNSPEHNLKSKLMSPILDCKFETRQEDINKDGVPETVDLLHYYITVTP